MFLAAQQSMNGWTPGAFVLAGSIISAAIGVLCLLFGRKGKKAAGGWIILAILLFILTGVIGKH